MVEIVYESLSDSCDNDQEEEEMKDIKRSLIVRM